jgi:hypothetical protein
MDATFFSLQLLSKARVFLHGIAYKLQNENKIITQAEKHNLSVYRAIEVLEHLLCGQTVLFFRDLKHHWPHS